MMPRICIACKFCYPEGICLCLASEHIGELVYYRDTCDKWEADDEEETDL